MAAPPRRNPRQEAKRAVREVYERFNRSPETWNLGAVEDTALNQIQEQNLASPLLAVAVRKLVEEVDREHKPSNEPTLFDLDVTLPQGDRERISLRLARQEHLRIWLLLDDENRDAVVAANRRKHDVFDPVLPYFRTVHTRFEEAAEAYRADHPEEDEGLPEAGH